MVQNSILQRQRPAFIAIVPIQSGEEVDHMDGTNSMRSDRGTVSINKARAAALALALNKEKAMRRRSGDGEQGGKAVLSDGQIPCT